MWKMSYRFRLVIGILAVLLPIVIVMTMNRMSIVKHVIYERELSRLNTIGQLLADEVEENLAANATHEVAEILALSALQPDIIRVNVLDTTARIIHSSDSGREGKQRLHEDTDGIANLRGATYVASFKINSPQGHHTLQILYSLVETHKDFAVALHWAIVFDLLIFGGAAAMAWLVSGFMEQPVRAATRAAQQIATGNFDISLEPTTNDAYGRLVEALGQMAGELRELTHAMQVRIDTATAELIEKNRRLKELDRLKSEFVAMVSHELRTPLTSIIGFARTLKRVPMPDEKKQECLSIIEKQGKHLSLLIEGYLDISKIETGNFSLHCAQVHIESIVCGVVEAFPCAANVRLHIEKDLPEVHADNARLQQVFRNILENAIRHGGKDVAIEVRVREEAGAVEVSITDNGPGISPDVQERVFDKFFRADAQRGGSGLGLTMVKAIIEAHSGDVRCESVQGQGTNFIVRLPITGPTEKQGVIHVQEDSGR